VAISGNRVLEIKRIGPPGAPKRPSSARGFGGIPEEFQPFDAKSCNLEVSEAGFLTFGSTANLEAFPHQE
jgi:hypothetical protein